MIDNIPYKKLRQAWNEYISNNNGNMTIIPDLTRANTLRLNRINLDRHHSKEYITQDVIFSKFFNTNYAGFESTKVIYLSDALRLMVLITPILDFYDTYGVIYNSESYEDYEYLKMFMKHFDYKELLKLYIECINIIGE